MFDSVRHVQTADTLGAGRPVRRGPDIIPTDDTEETDRRQDGRDDSDVEF
ncbi:hypothetical protein JKA73_32390 [Myxococcus xanthus]|nr:hypothetical protein [Myxococcus xanthus]QQR43669.1 hypothetical protein JKA73_32390 [Myxococcus xanthus]